MKDKPAARNARKEAAVGTGSTHSGCGPNRGRGAGAGRCPRAAGPRRRSRNPRRSRPPTRGPVTCAAGCRSANFTFTAYLPGTICRGSAQPQLSLECHDSQDPWLLAPGAIALFTPDRNFFPGHSISNREACTTFRHSIQPRPRAMPGSSRAPTAARTFTASPLAAPGNPARAIDQWGSDIAGIQTQCGPRVLATRATSLSRAGRHTALRARPSGGQPIPAGPALEFSGPITALWSAGNSATAVSRDLQTGRYAAYSLAATCGS